MASDLSQIGDRLRDLKRQTEQGFYAPVTNVSLTSDEETVVLTLDYPDTGSTGEYRVSIPTYWEDGRELVDFLRRLDITPDTFEKITNRKLPITRVSGSWQVDTERLQSGDYALVSPIRTFDVVDNTANDTVEFDISYDVVSDGGDRLELTIDDLDTTWADSNVELDGFSGTYSSYSQGGATGDFEITLDVLDVDGNVVHSDTKTVTAG